MKRSGIGTEIYPNSDSEPTKSKGELKIDNIFFVGGSLIKRSIYQMMAIAASFATCVFFYCFTYKHQLGNDCT